MPLDEYSTLVVDRGPIRLVAQIGPQPAFYFRNVHALAAGVVLDLVAGDAIDGEIFCLRMGEIETADTSRRLHGIIYGEPNTGRCFRVEQLKRV